MQRATQVQPIVEDSAAIARALESASIPTLLASLVHVTGDTRFLRGPVRPRRAVMGEVHGGLSPEEKAHVRREALAVLDAYRDGGCKLPPLPSPETIRELMSFVVGEPVPDEYVPMMLEEMELDGEDVRGLHWERAVPAAARSGFRVAVIGAGMSGLLAAFRLQQAGIPYTVIEKNAAVGGTWFENSYPGCRVDVANHFYSYSFEPNHDWPEYFSQRADLFAYFERCVDAWGLRPRIRFETEVRSAHFDEASARWELRLRAKHGREETLLASAIVSAVGQLNRPRIPEIRGLETFAGPWFHSAAWQHEHDLAGRRVAVIGTGASAFQLVPELAKVAGRLSVFQRSPAWMVPNPVYHAAVSEGKKWLLKHVPFYARWYRFLLFWPGSDGLLPSLVIDPSWPHPERSVNALNEEQRVMFTEYLRSQVRDDPELLEKVIPKYPPFGKRMLQDDGSWLAALQRENVELVTSGIREIAPDAVVCEDGSRHPADVIVFATGFHADRFLWPMQVEGRGGALLREVWGDEPRAYLGITVPRFPNLFCLYGPGTNLAHAGSIIFHSECQVRYVMGCLKALLETGHRTLDCRQEVYDAYRERLVRRLSEMVWSHPGMTSWYKNARGLVTQTSPWRLVDYWRWTREPELADYVLG
jgi:4-hydroxyacetophenone monooxygenase